MTTVIDRIMLKLDTILLRQQLLDNEVQDLAYQVQKLTNVQTAMRQQETKIMAEIDDLTTEVEAVHGVEDSAVATITRLADSVNQLVRNATDLASLKTQVAAQTQKMKDNAQPLADAIAANP